MPLPSRLRGLAFALALLGAHAVLGAAPLSAEDFLSAIPDVPLMEGFTERADEGMVFEAASGRIVSAVASGAPRKGLDAGTVLGFYAATLPALGWRAEGAARFSREGELLILTVEETPARLTLGFELRPR